VTDPALVPEVQWINQFLSGEVQNEVCIRISCLVTFLTYSHILSQDPEAGTSKGKGKEKDDPDEEAPPDSTECDESDGGVECGCCFGTYVFVSASWSLWIGVDR